MAWCHLERAQHWKAPDAIPLQHFDETAAGAALLGG
jgi:hypothetical protein